jgi:hypothetical protein
MQFEVEAETGALHIPKGFIDFHPKGGELDHFSACLKPSGIEVPRSQGSRWVSACLRLFSLKRAWPSARGVSGFIVQTLTGEPPRLLTKLHLMAGFTLRLDASFGDH